MEEADLGSAFFTPQHADFAQTSGSKCRLRNREVGVEIDRKIEQRDASGYQMVDRDVIHPSDRCCSRGLIIDPLLKRQSVMKRGNGLWRESRLPPCLPAPKHRAPFRQRRRHERPHRGPPRILDRPHLHVS